MYKAILVQDGEGCDYTIGCGINVYDIHADFEDDALDELHKIVINEFNYDECRLKSATLLCLTKKVDAPVEQWYEQDKQQKDAEKYQEVENGEKAELERLKAKYGE